MKEYCMHQGEPSTIFYGIIRDSFPNRPPWAPFGKKSQIILWQKGEEPSLRAPLTLLSQATHLSKNIILTWDNFPEQPQTLVLVSAVESSWWPAPRAAWSFPHPPPPSSFQIIWEQRLFDLVEDIHMFGIGDGKIGNRWVSTHQSQVETRMLKSVSFNVCGCAFNRVASGLLRYPDCTYILNVIWEN